MTGDKSKFSSFTLEYKGFVTYVDSNKGKVISIGKVGTPPFTTIDDVLYIEGLKQNLLSISQLCEKGLKINFNKEECIIKDEITHEIKIMRKRIKNILMISLKLKFLVVNKNNDA